MATVIEYYAVMCETDGYSGGVGDNIVARFLSRSAALEFAKRNPTWYYVEHTKRTFTVYDTVQEYDEVETVKIRQAALAKLTTEERTILGLV